MISNQFHRIIFILSKIHLHTSIDHHLYMCVCVFIVSVFQLFINFWNLFFFLVLSTTTTKKNYPPPSPGLILFWRYRFVIFQINPTQKKNDKCLKNNLIYSVYIYITIIWNLKQFSSAVLCVCVCVVSGYWFRLLFVFVFFQMNYSDQRDKRLHR